MGLQALKIVQEEFNDVLEDQVPKNIWLPLMALRERIQGRIEAECIGQPESSPTRCLQPLFGWDARCRRQRGHVGRHKPLGSGSVIEPIEEEEPDNGTPSS